MSTLTLFAIIFVFLLVIGGWVTSEIISNKTTKTNKKYTRQMALMERENHKLQTALIKENDRYTRIKEEYDQLKDAKSQIRILETDYRKLLKQHNHIEEGLEALRKKTTSKKYSSNSLAKDIIIILDEYSPSDDQKEQNKTEETQDTFKRIKSAMGMGGN